MNGTLRTGNKSELANVVTEDIYCPEIIQLHATSSFLIIDGQALVVALGKPDAAVTFGDLADTYVKTVLKAGSEYHRLEIVLNRYRDETIEGTTRTRRSKTARPIRWLVEGRDVRLPNNWSNFLSVADNKADLAQFCLRNCVRRHLWTKKLSLPMDLEMNSRSSNQQVQLIWDP